MEIVILRHLELITVSRSEGAVVDEVVGVHMTAVVAAAVAAPQL